MAEKKIEYEKPELIDIAKRGAEGEPTCDDGSGADRCETGAGALTICFEGAGGDR